MTSFCHLSLSPEKDLPLYLAIKTDTSSLGADTVLDTSSSMMTLI